MSAATLLGIVQQYCDALEVAEARDIIDAIVWDMIERRLEPNVLPCLKHLDRAAEIAAVPERGLVEALARDRRALRWGQTYAIGDFGKDFLAGYGWMELFGIRGHFVNEERAAGFLVLGPRRIYPDHHHVAEEIYVPLTWGSHWRKGDGPFAPRRAGEVIHHPSGVSHAMWTGREPLVALYFWRGGPLDQKSVVRPRPPLEGRPGAEVEVS